MSSRVLHFAVTSSLSSLIALALSACVVAGEPNGAEENVAAERASVTVTPVAYPPANAQYCPQTDPKLVASSACSVSVSFPHVVSSPSPYAFLNGLVENGCVSVTVSGPALATTDLMLCPDNATTTIATSHIGPVRASKLDKAYCSPCVPKAPAGQVYVKIWTDSGPGCTSGCLHQH